MVLSNAWADSPSRNFFPRAPGARSYLLNSAIGSLGALATPPFFTFPNLVVPKPSFWRASPRPPRYPGRVSLADRVLSELALHAGWVDGAGLAEARAEAERSRLPVGQALVRQRRLRSGDLVVLLRTLDRVVLRCSACQREYGYASINPRGSGTCPTCGVELQVANLSAIRIERPPSPSGRLAAAGLPGTSGRVPAPAHPGTPLADTRPDDASGSSANAAAPTPMVAPAGPSTPAVSGRFRGTSSRRFHESGEQFGPYELVSELGRGGMGVVYKARRTGLDRFVALKILLGSHTASTTRIKRFQREAELAAKLRHPGIVQVHDFGQVGEHYYLTMDYVEGRPLNEVIDERALSEHRAAEIARGGAEALAAAHAAGVIHRDIKPANMMLASDGRPVITDFGLARQAELEGETTQLTRDGALVGTPFYMSPEQASGKRERVVPKSDVWSLGIVLYQMVCGALPFDATSQLELSNKILHEDPTPPRSHRPQLDADLETIILKALEKDPERRYSAQQLAEELSRFLAGETLKARPLGPLQALRRKLRGRRVAVYSIGAVIAALEVALWGGLHTRLALAEAAATQACELRLSELREAASAAKAARIQLERAAFEAAREAESRVERLWREAGTGPGGSSYQDALGAVLDAIQSAITLPSLRDSPKLELLRGRALARRLDPEQALAAFLRTVELDPRGPFGAEASYRLAGLRERARDSSGGLEVLEKALARIDGEAAGAWFHMLRAAQALLSEPPDIEQAGRSLDRVEALSPRLPEAAVLRIGIARSQGDLALTLRAAQRAAELDPKSVVAICELARANFPADRRRAADLAERALALDPDFAPGLEIKAALLHAEGKVSEAFAIYVRLVEVFPRELPILFRAAMVASEAGEEAESNRLWVLYEERAPNSHLPYLVRAANLKRDNEHLKALAELRRGAEALGTRGPAAARSAQRLRHAFATSALHLSRPDLIENFGQALQRANDLNGDAILARAWIAQQKLPEARRILEALLAKEPLHPEGLFFYFELLGREPQTEARVLVEIQRVEKVGRDDPEALLVAAQASLSLLDDLDVTRRLTARIVELAPKDRLALSFQARILAADGKTREALSVLAESLEEDPSDVTSARVLAAIVLNSQEPEQAIPYLDLLLRYEPFDESATSNLLLALSRRAPRRAAEIATRYIEYYDSAKVTPSPVIVRAYVSLCLSLRQPDEGFRLVRSLFARYKRHEYLLAQAEALIALSELERAQGVLDEVRAIAPKSPNLAALQKLLESRK